MTERHDLQILIRRADPLPDDRPLPDPLLAERPSAVDIMGSAVARPWVWWRGPLVAAAAAAALLLVVGAVLVYVAAGRDPGPADQPAPTVVAPDPPDGDPSLDDTSSIESSGSGPTLVWTRVEAPGNGLVGTVLWDDGRYYLADYHPEDQPPEFAGSWFVSDDGLGWQRLEGSEVFPDEGEIVAHDGRLVRVALPEAVTLDVDTGEIAVSRLDMGPLLEIDDPCFEPGPVCGRPHPVVTAGGRGVLVVIQPWSVPTLELCPPAEGAPSGTPDVGDILGGGRVVAEGCWVVNREYPVHPLAWFSADGLTWSAVPRRGPFTAGSGEILDVVGIDSGFALLRHEPVDESVEVWFSTDGVEWDRLAAPDGFRGVALSSWGDSAIAASDTEFGWGDTVRGVEPLWLVTPGAITPVESEPLPELRGFGGIVAGPAGIVIVYSVEGSLHGYDVVLEFSTDGSRWSRRTVSDDLTVGDFVIGDDVVSDHPQAGDFVVGDDEVLRVGPSRLGSTALFVGIPEWSDGR